MKQIVLLIINLIILSYFNETFLIILIYILIF